MSSENGAAEACDNEPEALEVEGHVAPRNGRASREVVARWGDLQFVDTIDTNKASARERFIERLAEAWQIEDRQRLQHLNCLLAARGQEADDLAAEAAREAADQAQAGEDKDLSAKALANTPKEVVEAAEAFLKNPNLMDELAEDFRRLGIAGETALAQIVYLIGASRLLDDPLGGSNKAAPASGKSYVMDGVTSLFPDEAVLRATDITANALYYLRPGSLRHKLVSVGERKHVSSSSDSETANATLALREMLSRGRLDKFVPMRTDDGVATVHIAQEGPIAYLETTTQQEVFEEDATRMLSLAADESDAQTRAIMAIQARQAAWATATPEEQEAVRQKHKSAQRMLRSLRVQIPFAGRLALPCNKLIARRAFPQLLGCIKAVALLRQRQMKLHDGGYVVATENDYEIAYRLMLPILRRTFAPLSQRAITLLGTILKHRVPQDQFTRADCQKWAGVGLTEVRNRLSVLVEAGLVEQDGGGKGVKYTYRVVGTAGARPPALQGLITPEGLRQLLEEEAARSRGPSQGRASAAPE